MKEIHLKQETLEEAAEKYSNKIWDSSNSNEKTLHSNCYKAFLKGAKWQAKRMYSEEEVFRLLVHFTERHGKRSITTQCIEIWFEQYKKK